MHKENRMKQLKKDIKNGVSKEEAFDRIKTRGSDVLKASRFLANIPDPDLADEYAGKNKILVYIYGFMVFIGLLTIIPKITSFNISIGIPLFLFTLLLPGVILYLLYKQRAVSYLLIVFISFKGIFDSLKDYSESPAIVLIGITLNIFFIIYAIYLKNKTFPYQNFFNTKKNSDGYVIFQNI